MARSINSLGSEDLFVSVISIPKDGQKKRLLQAWLLALERQYRDRLLDIDLETSRMWGELTAASDGLIAATARRHGLYIMTRNTADFELEGGL